LGQAGNWNLNDIWGRHFDILSHVDLEIKNTITLTSVLSRRGRGRVGEEITRKGISTMNSRIMNNKCQTSVVRKGKGKGNCELWIVNRRSRKK